MIELAEISEKQKSQTATKLKNNFLEQTHDEKLADSFERISKNLERLMKSGD